MAYKLNNKTLQADRGFTHNQIQYPRNWLKLSTEAERTAIGITWEADPVRADDTYYWDGDTTNPKALDDVNEVDENNNPIYVQEYDEATEAMVDTDEQLVTHGVKHNKTQEVKQIAASLLSETDWYVVRKSEKTTAIPSDVTTRRDAIRTECNRLETAIAGAADTAALVTVMESQDWGE
ncbi:MAG: hypothetical protein ACR2M9_04570 [Cyanophyceae cyanobacterium]